MSNPVRAIMSDSIQLVRSPEGDVIFQTTILLPELSDEELTHLLSCVNKKSGSLLVTFQEGIATPEEDEVLKDD